MARFSAGVHGQSTLKLQLTAPFQGADEITAITAFSEVEIGRASRPQLIRPLTAGVGRTFANAIQPFSGQGVPAGARDGTGVPVTTGPENGSLSRVSTVFTIEPEMPIVVKPSIQTPIFMRWSATPGRGVIVPANASIVLYATSSQIDHTWGAHIEWEEM